MEFSSLTKKVMKPNGKWSSRNGEKVSMVIIHHWAGTAGGIERLVYSSDEASSTYILMTNGLLIGSVPEQFRPWTSGNSSYDRKAITVETQNVSVNGYTVSDVQLEVLAKLIVDVARRYNWTSITRKNVLGHREVPGNSTSCPGPYLYPRLDAIVARANQLWKTSETKNVTYRAEVTASSLNVRSAPSVNSTIRKTWSKGKRFTIVQEKDGWGHCLSGGWVHLDYVKPLTTKKPWKKPAKEDTYVVKVVVDVLNVRQSPSTDSPVLGSVKRGQKVTITKVQNGWGKCKWRKGWIALKHTQKV